MVLFSHLSLVDRAHMKLVAAKAILRLLKQWENKIPIDVLYLALRTSEVDLTCLGLNDCLC